MDFRISDQLFWNVRIPLLWGSRAILRDQQGHLSIVNLEDDSPNIEVIDDQPAASANASLKTDGYVILNAEGEELYSVNPTTKSLTPIVLNLPAVTFTAREVRVGPHAFDVNMVGVEIGIVVSASGVQLGGSLPLSLGRLRV